MKVNTTSLKMEKIDEIFLEGLILKNQINIYYFDKDFLVVHINNRIFMPRSRDKEEH